MLFGSTYHRSQSRNSSLIPPCSKASASGNLPAIPRKPPAMPATPASPRSAPPKPPSRCSRPPHRCFGHRTNLIFCQEPRRSRERVSHTDSSIVFIGARRSSPWMVELRYDCGMGLDRDEDWMLPVKGADSRGSSRSFNVASDWA